MAHLSRAQIHEALEILSEEASYCFHPESVDYCYQRKLELMNELRRLNAEEAAKSIHHATHVVASQK